MKKRKKFLIAFACLGIIGFLLLQCYVHTGDFARYKLIRILQAADIEDVDSASEDGLTVYFQAESTVSFLKGALSSADIEDITGQAMSTLPAPVYLVGNTYIGAGGMFFSSFGNKQYAFSISSSSKKQLDDYVQALLAAGTLEGIAAQD